jgi:hypothetical protein
MIVLDSSQVVEDIVQAEPNLSIFAESSALNPQTHAIISSAGHERSSPACPCQINYALLHHNSHHWHDTIDTISRKQGKMKRESNQQGMASTVK